MIDWVGLQTVGEFIDRLSEFPRDWPVHVSTQAGGGVVAEHRDVRGVATICIYGSNGGRFGENPLTEKEYQKKSAEFLQRLDDREWRYTTVHGDHRLYLPFGQSDTCYGTPYDERIIDRMVKEGLLEYFKQLYSRDGVRKPVDWDKVFK